MDTLEHTSLDGFQLTADQDAVIVFCRACNDADNIIGQLSIHPDDAPTLDELTTWAHTHNNRHHP